MMNEHVPFTLLSDYHDEQLTAHQKQYVEDHLSRCEQCRQEYRKLLKMITMIAALEKVNIRKGEAFAASTLWKIKQDARKRRRRTLYRRVLPTAAAAMVLFIFGVDYLQKGSHVSERKTAIMGPSAADYNLVSSGNTATGYRIINSQSNIRKNLSILRRNRARILLITDSYIEAESSQYGYEDIKREIQANGIVSLGRVVGDSHQHNLDLIGDSHPLFPDFISQSVSSRQKTVRFRVNLR